MLIEDWKVVLKKAWSVKWGIAAAVFSGVEVVLALIGGDVFPRGIFASLSGTAALLGQLARVMAQREITTVEVKDVPTENQ